MLRTKTPIRWHRAGFVLVALGSAFLLSTVQTAPKVALQATPRAAWAGDLTVTFHGLKTEDGGTIRAALKNDSVAETYPDGATVQAIALAVTGETMEMVFPNLPSGTYAVSAFHDTNGDEELNTTIFGIPTEAYAFSNDARGIFGPPSFASAAFAVTEDDTSITINVP